MSKKTKKEKIIAAYRKKLRLLQQTNQPTELPNQETVKTANKPEPVETHHQKDEQKKQNETNKEDFVLRKYFFVDFRKSVVFIILIIALEIGIYFAKLIK
ncbi:hypothetical protein M1328_02715 [Patescibacteria group bacterium]|nr:hypothetical protein [Patescibacteria group bacterium]